MRILLTGAFGNIGANTITALRGAGHQVTCFDLPTKANLRSAKKLRKKIMVAWGDIRRRPDIARALVGQEVVIHLAAIIPPESERKPIAAEEVNIDGTLNLVEAMKAMDVPAKLIFASSVSVFGRKFEWPPPRTVDDPLEPSDNYSRHKIVCEEMIRSSNLTWAIMRFPAVPDLATMGIDPMMFEIALSTRIEFLHPRDAARALANAVSSNEVWGRVLLLGGGRKEQMEYCDYLGRTLEAAGIDRLPCEAFGCTPFYTDWMETRESERILHYQRHTFDDYLAEFRAGLGLKKILIPLVRPMIRRSLLRRSTYMPPGADGGRKGSRYWKDKVVLVTGASSGIGEATARRLAYEGLKVAIVARREDRLRELADRIRSQGGQALMVVADLTREDERVRVIDEVRAAWGRIDILINNAGFSWYGFGADMPWDVASRMIDLNVKAIVHFTLLVIRRMRAYNGGHVVNVSSIAGSFPQQGIMLYGASKAFMDSFSTSLFREMRGSNVHISLIKPGAVKTELFRVAENDPSSLAIPAEGLAVSVEKVVNGIWGLLNRPRRRVFVPGLLWFVPWIESCFGWFIDKLGPLLLRRTLSLSKAWVK